MLSRASPPIYPPVRFLRGVRSVSHGEKGTAGGSCGAGIIINWGQRWQSRQGHTFPAHFSLSLSLFEALLWGHIFNPIKQPLLLAYNTQTHYAAFMSSLSALIVLPFILCPYAYYRSNMKATLKNIF